MSRIIKASKLVQGQDPVTIAASWSVAGWDELAATQAPEGDEERWPWEARAVEDDAMVPAGEARGGPEEPEVEPGLTAREALAQERAAAIIAEAEAESSRTLDEAQAKAAILLEEARETGYGAGYADGERQGAAEGRAKAEADMEAAVKQTMRVLTAAVHEKNQIVAASRDDVLKILRKIAEKIIRAEARLDPSLVERAIDASLRLVTERNRVLVRVNQDEVDRARDGVPHFLRYFTPSAVVEVCADPRVTAGGCVIETNAGNVDAQLETQLEVVLRQLEERLYGG